MATAWRADAQHIPAPQAVTRPLHVLVVEDNPDCALSLTMLLQHNGFVVDIATTGIPVIAGLPLVAAGTLLLFIALIAAIVSQFRGHEPDHSLELPTKRQGPFEE